MLSPLDPFIQLIRPICIHNVFAKVMNNNNSLFMQPVGYIEHLSLSLSLGLSLFFSSIKGLQLIGMQTFWPLKAQN